MQIQQEPKGWSDAEVDQVIGHLETLVENTQAITENQDRLILLLVLLAMFVIAQFAWHAFGQFMPNAREISSDG